MQVNTLANPNHLRLLYEWKKNPKTSAYHNIFIYELNGPLHIQNLISAINSLPGYYPELNSYLSFTNGIPKKKLGDTQPTQFEDFSSHNWTAKAGFEYINDYLHSPFSISTPPLYRHILIKLRDDAFLLGLCWFHLIDDAVSVTLLVDKISQIYNRLGRGENNTISIVHHPDTFDFTYAPESIEYWKNKCNSINHFHVLLPQQQRIEAIQPLSKRYYFSLPTDLSLKALQYTADNHITLFVLLTSAFAALCHLFSEQEEMAIAYSVSTRKRKDLLAVGFHVNNIPLCFKFNKHLTFQSLIENVNLQKQQDTFHQSVPLYEITRILRNSSDHSQAAPFNFLVNQLTNNSFELKLDKIISHPVPVLDNEAKNDFTLFYHCKNQLIHLEFEYRTDLYHAEFIESFAESFSVFLNNAIDNPNQAIIKINLMSDQQYLTLVHSWNDIASHTLPSVNLISVFKSQVNFNPDQIALIEGNRTLTYKELDKLSNKVANYLIEKHGIKKTTIIGICCERSIDTLVAIVAIAKMGAIYLPIDISYPINRINFIVNDANPALLLTFAQHLPYLTALKSQTIIALEEIVADGNSSCIDLEFEPSLEDVCYLIYTSGTTGQPKGVMNRYVGLLNRLNWVIDTWQITPQDTFLQKTSLCFDVSLWEIWVPLLSGATLAIAEPESQRDPRKLLKQITSYQVSILHFVPSMLHAFLDHTENIDQTSLRIVATSGEALHFQLVNLFNKKLANVKLLNLYGPTEASIDVTYWDCSQTIYPGIIPIGFPLPNVTLYILDENKRPVPLGKSGELYIGGVALGLGYLNRLELTKERFIQNPFATESNSMLYKTGDICRWIGKQCIEYLGRNDQQIKLHGYRIELTEIEYHLSSHPDVEYCLVHLEQSRDNPTLITYIKTNTLSLDESQLRHYLAEHIPSYMHPHKFYFVDHIPINTQGKVDFNALRQKVYKKTTPLLESVQTHLVSNELRKIWSDVLNVPMDELHDQANFISLGGDSLSALKMISEVEQMYSCEISIASLLENPQLIDFDLWLKAHLQSKDIKQPAQNAACKFLNQTAFYPLSAAQKLLLNSSNNNIVIPFESMGELSIHALRIAIQQLTDRHRLTKINFVDKEDKMYFYNNHLSHFIYHDFRHFDEESFLNSIEEQYALLRNKPRDLAKDALFSVTALQKSDKNSILFFYFNHLIVDYASIQLILNEIFSLYSSQLNITPCSIINPSEYKEYVSDEIAFMQSPLRDEQVTFWLKQIGNKKRNIMMQHSRAYGSKNAGYFSVLLPDNVGKALERLVVCYHKTPFCILLTIFSRVFAKFINESDFAVGFTLSKRATKRYENTVGPIINYSLVHYHNEQQMPLGEDLERISKLLIHAYKNNDVPMENILEALRQFENNPSLTQLFDVFFDYEPIPLGIEDVNNVTFSALPIRHTTTMQRYISIRIIKQSQRYLMEMRFRTNLFKENEIALLASNYQDALLNELSVCEQNYQLNGEGTTHAESIN